MMDVYESVCDSAPSAHCISLEVHNYMEKVKTPRMCYVLRCLLPSRMSETRSPQEAWSILRL